MRLKQVTGKVWVRRAASALGGSIAGSAAFAKIATLIFAGMATAGIAVSAPVVIGAVATAAAVGAFAGSEWQKQVGTGQKTSETTYRIL